MSSENSIRKSLLVAVTSDPRTSHRPAEAVRIAAGVAAWRKVDVRLYLAGAAVLVLSSDVDDLVNEESFREYLPMLSELERAILVEANAPLLAKVVEPTGCFEAVGRAQLAALASQMTYVLRF